MKILLTGDRGYIGSVLVSILLKKGYEVVGLDVGFFEENILQDSISDYQKLTKDIRDIEQSDLDGIDAIIHLAGLSNDPLGDFSPKLTDDINNLAHVINSKYQTLTYFGIDKSELLGFVVKNRLSGIDRIVPVGKALDMDVMWDGYDIVRSLSRIIDVK